MLNGGAISDNGQIAEYIERAIYVDQLLDALDDREFCMIAARYWQGFSIRDVGRELGLTQSGSFFMRNRAFKKMKEVECKSSDSTARSALRVSYKE